jgi:hypothetical protein
LGTAAALCLTVISGRGQETNGLTSLETNAHAGNVTRSAEDLSSASGPGTNAPRPLGYEAFQIINERNIFNANRSRRSGREGRAERKPVKVDTFSLVGTMSYAKGISLFRRFEFGYERRPKRTTK